MPKVGVSFEDKRMEDYCMDETDLNRFYGSFLVETVSDFSNGIFR